MISAVVLARLLTPADYGTVAMVKAITAFVAIFADLGLSAATIQKSDISDHQSSNLFWINAAVGLAITLIVAALAPVLAWFYQKPELIAVTLALSLTVMLTALAAQQGALLNRELRFTALAIVRIGAMVAGVLVSIISALLGLHYWALVNGLLATSLVRTVGFWIAARWIPRLPTRCHDLISMLRFGSWIAGFSVVNYFSRNVDNVMIGRVWGTSELGLYSRAYSILMLPISNLRGPMDKVAFPALSKLQGEPARYKAYMRKYCSALAFLSMPFVAVLYVVSVPLIRLLLGPQWGGAAVLFGILAIASFIQPVSGLIGLVLLSLGRGRRYFYLGLYIAITTISAFLLGLPWGARGVATAYAISCYATLHPALIYGFRDTPLRPADFYDAIWRPATASVFAVGLVLWVRSSLHVMPDAFSVVAYAFIFSAIYGTVFTLLPGGWLTLRENVGHMRILLRR